MCGVNGDYPPGGMVPPAPGSGMRRSCGCVHTVGLLFVMITAGFDPGWGAPVQLVEQAPVSVAPVAPGVVLLDFGRVAFGNLQVTPPEGFRGEVTVHFGEALAGGRINRTPPGSVRYAYTNLTLQAAVPQVVAPPADARNTSHPAAVLTPAAWGVLLPFRWVEVEGWPGDGLATAMVRRAAFAATWDDAAAAFTSSDPMLDRIWELCRYSIKATTFAGVYVDGDRERIAYEADAYLNQICHYACDPDVQMARATFDRLLAYPTWPTEWAFHMIFMAHADWMQTGDRAWLSARYDHLVSKLLLDRARADGLLVSTAAHREKGDLVDWPGPERDGYVFTPVNTVVNAFHLRALALMSELATAVGRDGDAQVYAARYVRVAESFQRTLFDPAQHLYRDGEGTDHTSLHANLFPLAFGLVPPEHRSELADWLISRGMRGSVYAAHYLLTALFEQGRDEAALALICAAGDRSWRHMVESGTTITWEAWDQTYKPNQDWNHAWGAAPAHLLPRYVLGFYHAEPGGKRVVIRPHPGPLRQASGRVPTPCGPVEVRWENAAAFRLHLSLPTGVTARLELPSPVNASGVWMDRHPVEAVCRAGRWIVPAVTGTVALVVR